MKFEWDENKAKLNLEKHGISFVAAAHVFFDPHRIERIDDRNDYQEERYQVIGETKNGVLFVVNTIRGDAYRII